MTVVHPQTETRVEYAVRYAWADGEVTVSECADQEMARLAMTAVGGSVVQRTVTVTYGEWEPVQ